MLAAILVIPVGVALLALANRKLAPWLTLAGTTTILVLAGKASGTVASVGALSAAGGALSLDALAAVYLLLVAFVGMTASLYSIGYLEARGEGSAESAPRYRQYYPLFNIFLASMLAVPLVSNLAIVWIAIELTTVFSAFLVAYEDQAESLEAAWKYVALTSMGAMIALLGTLILYYGITAAGAAPTWSGLRSAAPGMAPAVLLIPFVLWLVGFGAKAGLVPLHTWLPDAHSQAPAPICALLSGVETSGALYTLLRIYPGLASNPGIAHPEWWYLVAGIGSVGTAAFLLLQVRDFKRLFAYSTIEHMGIIITACGLGAGADQSGTVYQFFAHSLTKSFCFYAAGLATIALGGQRIGRAGGLIGRAPLAGWALLLGGIAIAGAPPFALFISEFRILLTGFAAHEYLASSLLTAFIVLAFVAIMYRLGRVVFGPPGERGTATVLPLTCKAALIIAFIPVLVFGIYVPPSLDTLLHRASVLLGGAS